jgi:DNA replication protein DnaC
MPNHADAERLEHVRKILDRDGVSPDLAARHLAAFQEASDEPAFRAWHTERFRKLETQNDFWEAVPDREAFKTWQEQTTRDRLEEAGVPADFIPMTFDDVKQRQNVQGFDGARVTCRDFSANISERLEAGAGLVICGTVGTGKTMLASLLCRAAISAIRSASFIRARSMLDRLKDWDTAQDFRERVEGVSLLVLDDLGAEYKSEWSLAEIDAMISARHERRRSTVVTSNMTPVELAKCYSPRVVDRLRERGPALEISGPSWRKK